MTPGLWTSEGRVLPVVVLCDGAVIWERGVSNCFLIAMEYASLY
jgi:hypothetical protein